MKSSKGEDLDMAKKKNNWDKGGGDSRASKPAKNQAKKSGLIVIVALVTVLLIGLIYKMGLDGDKTVLVAMVADTGAYKNQPITEDNVEKLFTKYAMNKKEFSNYSTVTINGTKRNRIVLWSDRADLVGAYAAYPLKGSTYLMYDQLTKNKTDNSDSVLYSFPGKTIVKLSVGTEDLNAFKAFLEPGDRINLKAIYTTKVTGTDGKEVNVTKVSDVMTSVIVADLLNSDGDSILDLYEYYNGLSTAQQTTLDSDDDWKQKTQPSSLVLALTPEELTKYYKDISIDATFELSLPQRNE